MAATTANPTAAADEELRRGLAIPGLPPRRDPGHRDDDALECQQVCVWRQGDGRMDEGSARDVDRRHERREREEDRGVRQERPEVHRPPLGPAPDQHERQEDAAGHERREDADGRHEAPDAAEEQRNGALAQQVAEGRRRRDRIPLLDRADVQDLARGGRRGELAEDLELADPPRRHDREEQPEARDRRPHGESPVDGRRPTATPASGRRGRRDRASPPTSSPSFRDRVARPTRSPPIANDRAWPRRPRAAIQSAPATSGW